MQENFEKLSRMITIEFQDHIEQIIGVIKDDKDIENAAHEAIEVRIGQVDNIEMWGELASLYIGMLNEKLAERTRV